MMWQRIKAWADKLRRDVITLYIASRDARTPWIAKVCALVIVAYALSPIDLIPDFIPVVGYLDEVILLPLGIVLVLRLIPDALLDEFRRKAETAPPMTRQFWGAILVVALWICAGVLIWQLL